MSNSKKGTTYIADGGVVIRKVDIFGKVISVVCGIVTIALIVLGIMAFVAVGGV